uniref:Uncharacterized protein n=1 Tax=Acanthochromis polyacanthus TaxID=80966 RepID=A0A3Q1GMQ0_9TELE
RRHGNVRTFNSSRRKENTSMEESCLTATHLCTHFHITFSSCQQHTPSGTFILVSFLSLLYLFVFPSTGCFSPLHVSSVPFHQIIRKREELLYKYCPSFLFFSFFLLLCLVVRIWWLCLC